MRFIKITTLLLLITLSRLSAENSDRLYNDKLDVTIETDASSGDFGAIRSIRTADNKISVPEITFFRLECGDKTAQNREIVSHCNDSLILRLSLFGTVPLTALVKYSLVDDNLRISYKCWTSDTAEFKEGLSLSCSDTRHYFDKVRTCVNGFDAATYDLSSKEVVVSDLDNVVCFYGNDNKRQLACSMINPFHSFWQFNKSGNGIHRLDFLPVMQPNSPFKDEARRGPPIVSTVFPYDTIFRDLSVSLTNTSGPAVAFSEHVNGFAPAVTMFWDELPNRDHWKFMTTENNKEVEYDHFWVRLMNEHPRLKMGYLLILERILFRDWTSFANWDLNSQYIIADSLDEHKGNFCVNLIARDSVLKIHQTVNVKPSTKYKLVYWMKTENITGVGAYGEVYSVNRDKQLASGSHILGNSPWTEHEISFCTDQKDSAVTIYLRIQDGSGSAYFDAVRLTADGSSYNLVKNGGFENNDPGYMFENKRRHWADASGIESVIHNAPESYIKFLRRLDTTEMMYGWEDRVRLGSHGWHHTPSIREKDQPAPGWEFQYYDTTGDKLRIEKIFEGTAKIGLSRNTLRYWRSPGYKYTASLVNLLADSGFVFMGGQNFSCHYCVPLVRGNKRLWVNGHTFWADYDQDNSTDLIFSTLARGHLGEVGGHPDMVLLDSSISSYERMNQLFTSMEREFSNLGYVFPDEYGDNANSIYTLHNCTDSAWGTERYLRFNGSVKAGVSVVLKGLCDDVFLDGVRLPVKRSDENTYAILPETSFGTHTVTFTNVIMNDLPQTGFSGYYSNQIKIENNMIKLKLISRSQVKTEIYNLSGRTVFSGTRTVGKNRLYQLNLNNVNMANCVYLLKITVNGELVARRTINFRRS